MYDNRAIDNFKDKDDDSGIWSNTSKIVEVNRGSLMSLFAKFVERTKTTTDEDDELYELESLIADLNELMHMASESNQDIRYLEDLKAYEQKILLRKHQPNRNREPKSGVVQDGPKKEEIKSDKPAQT